uniref:Fibronectin type III domain-containing protein n=1 Tax=Megaselia scalaris TaxID=36166 RepID=T1GZB0_MEGSC
MVLASEYEGCKDLHIKQADSSVHFHLLQEEPSTAIDQRCTRSRINSAIFVSSEGRGFDSIEFLRRHGSQSVLCRKARSAENITDDDRKFCIYNMFYSTNE